MKPCAAALWKLGALLPSFSSFPSVQDLLRNVGAKSMVAAIDEQQLLTCLRLRNVRVGLLINFHLARLVDGIRRVVHQLVE